MLALGKALLESATERSRLYALRCDAFVLEEESALSCPYSVHAPCTPRACPVHIEED